MAKIGKGTGWRVAWAALVLVLLAGALWASTMSSAKRDRLVRDATASARSTVTGVLWPGLRGADVRAPIGGARYEEIDTLVTEQVAGPGPVRSVRIWSPDGTLLFADEEQLVGRRNAQMRPALLATLGSGVRSDVVKDSLRTLVPISFGAKNDTVAVVELDRPYDPIAAEADSPWRLLMLLAIAGAVLSALVLARSIRAGKRGHTIGFSTSNGESAEETGPDALAEVAARRRTETALRAAEAHAKDLQRALDAARTELAEAAHRLQEEQGARHELERARDELARLESRSKDADAQREAMRRELDAVRTQLASKQADMRSARDEMERLAAARPEPEAPSDDELASVRAELDAARTELSAAKALATELASVQSQLSAAKEHARSLTLRAEEAETTAATAEGARQSVDEELAAVRAELTHLRAELDVATSPAHPEPDEVRNPLSRLREILADEPSTNGDTDEGANSSQASPDGVNEGPVRLAR